MITIAINGFGRIGRTFLRTLLLDPSAQKKIRVHTINIGPCAIEGVAHSFKYDSLMGTYQGNVHMDGASLCIDNHRIEIIAEPSIEKIEWAARSISWVVEASGRYTQREKAQLHIKGGATHVLITAPAPDADVTVVPGINDAIFDIDKHSLVSLGSCTTNAVTPMLKVLDDHFGIAHALMTTVHAYTNTQVLLDNQTTDPRRSRAAALNIVPSTTGVSETIEAVLPGMGAKFQGTSLRVPVAKVSIIDLVFNCSRPITQKLINEAFKNASTGSLYNILAYTDQELVSTDYYNCPYSVVIDSKLTMAQGTMCKIFGWYDNEWGYCQRLKDLFMLY